MEKYETDRLLLRKLRVDEYKLLQDYLVRNINFLREWEPIRDETYYSLDSNIVRIEEENLSFENKTTMSLYIFNKGSNKIIGNITLSNIVYGPFQSCFLGYKLDETEINQGKMTEALNRVIGIAFNDYNLHRIEANIMPGNIRSIKVITKLGFNNEGLSPKYLKINGKWEDHLHYVLLNEKVE